MAKTEQEIFLAAYIVRKLLDSKKISDEVESSLVKGSEYPSHNHPVDIMNWHKIDELYDLSSEKEITLELREFCNQIIHSFVFVPSVQDGLEGFFVASDRKKSSRVFYFEIEEIIHAVERVAYDNIVDWSAKRTTGKEMKIVKKSDRLGVSSDGEVC